MDDTGWDSSLAGAGAQRAVAICQLYFRMCRYHPLTIVVTDALALVFSSHGAQVSELSSYLGLRREAVEFGLSNIPKQMTCMLSQLSDDHPYRNDEAYTDDKLDPRWFLNYKEIVGIAYGHVSRILLLACAIPLPDITDDSIHVTVSAQLKRSESTEGIRCFGCNGFFALSDFNTTVQNCPVCGSDILRDTLHQIKLYLESELASGRPIVHPLPASKALLKGGTKIVLRSKGERSTSDLPLTRDPFLVQQAIVFFYLYDCRFAFVNEGNFVLDPDELLTEFEFEKRIKGKTSIMDSFRAKHRNVSSIRVRVLDQESLEKRKREENERKLQKRLNLPPWLRTQYADHTSLPPRQSPTGGGGSRISATTADRKRSRSAKYSQTSKFIVEEHFLDSFEPVALPNRKNSS